MKCLEDLGKKIQLLNKKEKGVTVILICIVVYILFSWWFVIGLLLGIVLSRLQDMFSK